MKSRRWYSTITFIVQRVPSATPSEIDSSTWTHGDGLFRIMHRLVSSRPLHRRSQRPLELCLPCFWSYFREDPPFFLGQRCMLRANTGRSTRYKSFPYKPAEIALNYVGNLHTYFDQRSVNLASIIDFAKSDNEDSPFSRAKKNFSIFPPKKLGNVSRYVR